MHLRLPFGAHYTVRLLVAIASLWLITSCGIAPHEVRPTDPKQPVKREFRGAWLPTIYRSDYASRSRDEARELLANRIALLQRLGCNAVIFQVRAEGDAFYQSDHEPWSKYLTGKQGQAPDPSWDPLGFVIEECHARGMELHAWVNPYRGAGNADAYLAPNHPAKKFPDLFIRYGKQLYMDPGNPQSVRYICSIVRDIIQRYDIDALHFDDYFYPYPKDGMEFDDEESFSRFGLTAGYRPEQKNNWRRENVNHLIYSVRQTILETKPWVRFGISPFGIYRNASSSSKGSKTAGLQTYDDLHADVLHWVQKGWVDYIIPQVYWNIGHQVADYAELTKWWGKHTPQAKAQLYIGQHALRTMDGNQLEDKLALSRKWTSGNSWWSGEDLLKNYKGLGDSLLNTYQSYRALLPEVHGALGKTKAPAPIKLILEDTNEDGHMLLWDDYREPSDPESAFYYAVYAFPEGTRQDISDTRYLLSVSNNPYFILPSMERGTTYHYLVTAINRFWQESKPTSIRIRY